MYRNIPRARRLLLVAAMVAASGTLTSVAGAAPLTTATITTVAGDGYPHGDNRPATRGHLTTPMGVAADRAGVTYIADAGQHRVRKVDTNGVITTVAGTGRAGFNGDNIPAVEAELDVPNDVAVDAAGNLYISDSSNRRIRRVDTNGFITTFAGNGENSESGDGGLAVHAAVGWVQCVDVDPAGVVWVCANSLRRVGSDGIIRTQPFNVEPSTKYLDVVTDRAGNVYFAAYDDHFLRLRKWTTDGRLVEIGPMFPRRYQGGVTADNEGNIYFITSAQVIKFDANGVGFVFAGGTTPGYDGDGKPAVNSLLDVPSGLAVDGAGDLLIADSFNGRVRKVQAGVISTVAGCGRSRHNGDSGPATFAAVQTPASTVVDSAGNLYISDSWNNVIRKVATDGTITTFARVPAVGLAIDRADNIYATDISEPQVRKITPSGVVTRVAGNGSRGYSGDGGLAVNAQLNHLVSIAVDGADNLYIADSTNARVRKVAANGIITTVAGTGVRGFSGDGGRAVDAQLEENLTLGVDRVGNVYIGDQLNFRLRKVDTAGVIRTIAGGDRFGDTGDGGPAVNALLGRIDGMTTDPAGNTYLLIDSRVRKVDTNGIINRVAGTGVAGYSGDGGNALQAQLRQPSGASTDAAGNLYIADTFNNRVRKVAFG